MVRTIRSCDTCSTRFASLANHPYCDRCDEIRRSSSSVNANTLPSDTACIEQLETDVHSSDSEDSAGSEGGDEIRCTQLRQDDEEIENFENASGDENRISRLEIASKIPLQKENPALPEVELINSNVKMGLGGDICFICGQSLKNLKHRFDHIKRCSKKHSITARDVKVDTEIEIFEESEAQQALTIASSSRNPYTRQSSWHGDASLTLKLAAQGSTPLAVASDTRSSPRQTSLNSFLNNPIRNLNNVLLAGARRLTKQAEIKTAASESKAQGLLSRGVKRRWSSFSGQRSTSSGCPAYKRISGTDFVCDGFHYAKVALTKNYFLTHFHSDHYGGIAKSWDHGIIYCSLPTAELVVQQLGVDRKYLHPLPMNTPTIIESKGKPITVTLLEANHCPGAVMLLFQVGKRHVLHVGDFRWNRDVMLQEGSPLRDFATRKLVLDELYLDTTYCNPKYSLPSQVETIAAIQTLFCKELERCSISNKTSTLHLFGAYTIGKEKMYLSVAEANKMKVYVDARRFRIISALNWPAERMALLTKCREEADIWVVPLGDINMKKLPEYLVLANSKPFSKPYDRVVGYRPTGWSMGSNPSSSLVSSRYNGNIIIHSVPYSEHSSFPELVDCLACLKPQCTIPTVTVSKSDEQVRTLMKALKEKQTTLPFAKLDS